MVIITGAILTTEENVDELLRLSLDHVVRSRQEPGCLSHAVHRDVENPLRLVFVEHWSDMEAVRTHFAVPDSGEFVTKAAALAVSAPELEVFEASRVG